MQTKAIALKGQPFCQAIFKNLGPNNLPIIYMVSHADPIISSGY